YDLRYVGQEYTVTVEESIDDKNSYEKLEDDFHKIHLNIYGHNNPEGAVEIVNLRVVSYGLLDKNPHKKLEADTSATSDVKKINKVIWDNTQVETKIYEFADLA